MGSSFQKKIIRTLLRLITMKLFYLNWLHPLQCSHYRYGFLDFEPYDQKNRDLLAWHVKSFTIQYKLTPLIQSG